MKPSTHLLREVNFVCVLVAIIIGLLQVHTYSVTLEMLTDQHRYPVTRVNHYYEKISHPRFERSLKHELGNILPSASSLHSLPSAYSLQKWKSKDRHKDIKKNFKKGYHKGIKGNDSKKGSGGKQKKSYFSKHKKGHNSSLGEKFSKGNHKDKHHREVNHHDKGRKGHHRSKKKHHNKGHDSKGFKEAFKKHEADRKKKFYDESDHQEYHIEYDTFDEYIDEHDEGHYGGGAKKLLKEHHEYGVKAHEDKAKHHENDKGVKKKYKHKEHENHHKKYDDKGTHKEASKHSTGKGHKDGAHSVHKPVVKPAAVKPAAVKPAVVKPAVAKPAVVKPAVTKANGEKEKYEQQSGKSVNSNGAKVEESKQQINIIPEGNHNCTKLNVKDVKSDEELNPTEKNIIHPETLHNSENEVNTHSKKKLTNHQSGNFEESSDKGIKGTTSETELKITENFNSAPSTLSELITSSNTNNPSIISLIDTEGRSIPKLLLFNGTIFAPVSMLPSTTTLRSVPLTPIPKKISNFSKFLVSKPNYENDKNMSEASGSSSSTDDDNSNSRRTDSVHKLENSNISPVYSTELREEELLLYLLGPNAGGYGVKLNQISANPEEHAIKQNTTGQLPNFSDSAKSVVTEGTTNNQKLQNQKFAEDQTNPQREETVEQVSSENSAARFQEDTVEDGVQVKGIVIRSKGDPDNQGDVELKKERSQQVAHVVGVELSPASSHHHDGKPKSKSVSTKEENVKKEGHKDGEGGKKSAGHKTKVHKEHGTKDHKNFKDKGGKKKHKKKHSKSYKGHHKKGKKGKKGHKKGKKSSSRKGHKDHGFEEFRSKTVYSKKENHFDDSGKQSLFKTYDDFNSLFDKHKKKLNAKSFFADNRFHKSHGKKNHYNKGKDFKSDSGKQKHFGSGGFFDHLYEGTHLSELKQDRHFGDNFHEDFKKKIGEIGPSDKFSQAGSNAVEQFINDYYKSMNSEF